MNRIHKAILSLLVAVTVCIFGFASRWAVTARTVSETTSGTPLPILMYHFVLEDSSKCNEFIISVAEFEADMRYLKENGYTPIGMEELYAYTQEDAPLPEKPIMITFDDGYECIYQYAFPILRQYEFKAVFSVIGRYADQYSSINDHHVNYSHCTWEQLAEMQQSGVFEIGNHTYNLHAVDKPHRGAAIDKGENVLSYQQRLREDLSRVQILCGKYLEEKPITFAYPYGFSSSEALPVIKELGFLGALTCKEEVNYLTGDPEELYHLGRFNRPTGKSAEYILTKAHA